MASPVFEEIPTHDWPIKRGDRFGRTITATEEDGTPINLTGLVWRAQVRRTKQSTQVLAQFTIDTSQAATGVIGLILTSAQTAGLPPTGQTPWVWDLEETTAEQTYIEGNVWVSEDVSRP